MINLTFHFIPLQKGISKDYVYVKRSQTLFLHCYKKKSSYLASLRPLFTLTLVTSHLSVHDLWQTNLLTVFILIFLYSYTLFSCMLDVSGQLLREFKRFVVTGPRQLPLSFQLLFTSHPHPQINPEAFRLLTASINSLSQSTSPLYKCVSMCPGSTQQSSPQAALFLGY